MTEQSNVLSSESPASDNVATILVEQDIDHQDRLAAFTEIAKLLEMGLTLTEAVDVYAVDVVYVDRERWAELRGCEPTAVNQMLAKGRRKLKGEVVG